MTDEPITTDDIHARIKTAQDLVVCLEFDTRDLRAKLVDLRTDFEAFMSQSAIPNPQSPIPNPQPERKPEPCPEDTTTTSTCS